MAVITGSPVYKNNVRQLQVTDPAAPATWDPIHQVLINNDAFLKQEINSIQIQTSQGEINFASTNGITVTHNVGNTNYTANIAVLADTGGDLGDVFITKTANAFTVYNTGGFTGLFRWQISS